MIYYKRYTGKLLPQKTAEQPSWVQWTHHSEGKTHCEDPYLFDPENTYRHGKNRAFESWGYSASDSTWLKNQSEKQALEKYLSGDYMLGKLDRRG